MPGKSVKLSTKYILFITLGLFIFGFISGYFYHKKFSFDPLETEVPLAINTVDPTPEPNTEIYPSPEGQKQLIAVNDPLMGGYSYTLILRDRGIDTDLSYSLKPLSVSWSPSSKKIAYNTGSSTRGYYTNFIDVATKTKTYLGGYEIFTQTLGKSTYELDNVYIDNIGWFNENLLIQVECFRCSLHSNPQLYLINPNTTKVIRRLY